MTDDICLPGWQSTTAGAMCVNIEDEARAERQRQEKKKNKARTYLTPADLFQWRFSRTHTTIPHMPNKKDQMKNTKKKLLFWTLFHRQQLKQNLTKRSTFRPTNFILLLSFIHVRVRWIGHTWTTTTTTTKPLHKIVKTIHIVRS